MERFWQKPILLGGIGVSVWLGLWHSSAAHLGGDVLWGGLFLYAGYRWWRRSHPSQPPVQKSVVVDRSVVSRALDQVAMRLQTLADEIPNSAQATLAQLHQELDRTEFHILVTGGKGVGKTSLIKSCQSNWQETPPLFTATEENPTLDTILAADLILFVVAGDLTAPELARLAQIKQPTIVVFNKQDQYSPEQRTQLLTKIQHHLASIEREYPIVSVAAAPRPLQIIRELADGSQKIEWEPRAADITALTAQLATTLNQPLIWATVLRKTYQLDQTIQAQINQVRYNRAQPILERYQWIAAASAFVNPVPSLDLLATMAINCQLVIDLGAIYQQKFSLEQAKNILESIADLIVKQGLVEFSSQAIAHLLKSQPIAYVAGGLIQGVSAAYLTRIVGLSLISYWQDASSQTPEIDVNTLGQVIQRVYQENQQINYLQVLLQQAISRLQPVREAAST